MGKIKVVRVVVDKNVLVSALLFGGVPGRVVSLWKSGRIQPLASQAMIDEVLRVLAYPKFSLAPKDVNMHGKPYAAQTIKHQIVIVRRLFNLARKWSLYSGVNPVDALHMPKVDNHKCEYLTDEETERLLQVLEDWDCRDTVAFIKFALLTGVKRSRGHTYTFHIVKCVGATPLLH